MAFTKVYIGAQGDLGLLMHNDILQFRFTVTNNDDSAFDFGAFTDVFMKIYDTRRGELLQTIPQSATNGLSITTNVIEWNATYADDIALFNSKTYYEELSFLDVDGKLITVLFGDLIII